MNAYTIQALLSLLETLHVVVTFIDMIQSLERSYVIFKDDETAYEVILLHDG
jgi:hypothetical protein